MNTKKAIYGIFTSFLFIIISILFLFAILFYQNIVIEFQGVFHETSSELQIMTDTKNKILQCYGNPLNTELIDTANCENLLIKSFEVTRFESTGCDFFNRKVIIDETIEFSKRVSFYIPVRKDSLSSVNCLGEVSLTI